MNHDEAVARANARYKEEVELQTRVYEEAVRKAREAQRLYIENTQLLARELELRLQEIEGETA